MKEVTIGLVGSGYGAYLHCNEYKRVNGVNVRLKTIVDVDVKKAQMIAEEYDFENVLEDFSDLLKGDEIDVVDICTPPSLHPQMVLDALKAGKHVICEKPLTGYFGEKENKEPIEKEVSKIKMHERVMEQLEKMKREIEKSDKKFMYAENFVYASNILKASEIITKKKSKILFMKGEENLRGSSSPVAGRWDKTGGGSLIRVGCHPLGGILSLKQTQAKARGEQITIKSVMAEMGALTPTLLEEEKKHFSIRSVDSGRYCYCYYYFF